MLVTISLEMNFKGQIIYFGWIRGEESSKVDKQWGGGLWGLGPLLPMILCFCNADICLDKLKREKNILLITMSFNLMLLFFLPWPSDVFSSVLYWNIKKD